jgi:aconitate hydratase
VSKSLDSFNCRRTLTASGTDYVYYDLIEAEKNGLTGIAQLPYSMKVLLENLLRNEDGRSVTKESIQAVAGWLTDKGTAGVEIAYRPARVLMQDFTGVPAVVDLAAMRDAMASLGGDPQNPRWSRSTRSRPLARHEPGTPLAFARNRPNTSATKSATNSLNGPAGVPHFRVVPLRHRYLPPGQSRISPQTAGPGSATVRSCPSRHRRRYRSYTTMVNGLSVLGWGVGASSEAEMLSARVSMPLRGDRLRLASSRRASPRPIVLTVTQMLRKKGVLAPSRVLRLRPLNMTLADRATIGKWRPNGATCGFFGRQRNHPLSTGVAVPKAASRWSRNMPRRKACGATPAPPIQCLPTCSSSISPK